MDEYRYTMKSYLKIFTAAILNARVLRNHQNAIIGI